MPFLVPIILSVHMLLGAYCEPASLKVPAGFLFRTLWIFRSCTLLIHTDCRLIGRCTFLCTLCLDSYIRKFVRHLCHSHHEHFVDPRHIGYTLHLWSAFVVWLFADSQYGISLPTSPGFRPSAFPPLPAGVSG